MTKRGRLAAQLTFTLATSSRPGTDMHLSTLAPNLAAGEDTRLHGPPTRTATQALLLALPINSVAKVAESH
jgi:hypothetical protein